jgi:hypothetical protein
MDVATGARIVAETEVARSCEFVGLQKMIPNRRGRKCDGKLRRLVGYAFRDDSCTSTLQGPELVGCTEVRITRADARRPRNRVRTAPGGEERRKERRKEV